MTGYFHSRPKTAGLLAASMLVLLTACQPTPLLPDPLTAGWRGARVCEKLHENRYQRVLRCTFPPGVGHERHYHRPHTGYVIQGGRMRITDADGEREVAPVTGATFTSEGIAWHEVLNAGATTAVFLIVEDLH